MNLLLDTHVLLWWLMDDPQLSAPAQQVILDSDNIVHVSAVSLWEIAIKEGRGRLELPEEFDDAFSAQGFRELPITWAHAQQNRRLPWLHRDPFDRLLIAQAQTEQMTLVTSDHDIRRYDVPCFT